MADEQVINTGAVKLLYLDNLNKQANQFMELCRLYEQKIAELEQEIEKIKSKK